MRKQMMMLAFLALMSGVASLGCARNPAPTGGPTDVAFNADQLLKDVAALQGVATSLNQAQGVLHISDKDLQVVNDFAKVATSAILAYQGGANSLGVVLETYNSFVTNLSPDIYLNDSFRFVLNVVNAGIKLIPGQLKVTVGT